MGPNTATDVATMALQSEPDAVQRIASRGRDLSLISRGLTAALVLHDADVAAGQAAAQRTWSQVIATISAQFTFLAEGLGTTTSSARPAGMIGVHDG